MKKEERYALIRKFALKAEKNQRVDKKYDTALKYMDDRSNLGWGDTDKYIDAHYGDVVRYNNE